MGMSGSGKATITYMKILNCRFLQMG